MKSLEVLYIRAGWISTEAGNTCTVALCEVVLECWKLPSAFFFRNEHTIHAHILFRNLADPTNGWNFSHCPLDKPPRKLLRTQSLRLCLSTCILQSVPCNHYIVVPLSLLPGLTGCDFFTAQSLSLPAPLSPTPNH